ncbi:MAG: SDR family oxidoreductase [Bacteroidetes bacterium]|nr:SDR family oxidoreductase [Bacteroidota bacterium]MBS1632606.1 SDR family oxidoreductase [Bacteroidota bacterium]
MNLSLEGKYAVICGSTQGIGLAIAEELALQGAHCTLMARNEASLQSVIGILDSSLRQQHNYLVADFSKPDEVKNVIELHVKDHPVHILVNNTGGPPAGPAMEVSENDFLKAMNQHLICNHILARAVIPSMKKEGNGRIINIISSSVRIPIHNLMVSNTTRAAVASWAKTLSNEVGQFNITVNSILPGFISTGRLDQLIEGNAKRRNSSRDKIIEEMITTIPLKRFGDPSEIGAIVAFLASPAASYINGVSIPVDGGKTGTI